MAPEGISRGKIRLLLTRSFGEYAALNPSDIPITCGRGSRKGAIAMTNGETLDSRESPNKENRPVVISSIGGVTSLLWEPAKLITLLGASAAGLTVLLGV